MLKTSRGRAFRSPNPFGHIVFPFSFDFKIFSCYHNNYFVTQINVKSDLIQRVDQLLIVYLIKDIKRLIWGQVLNARGSLYKR